MNATDQKICVALARKTTPIRAIDIADAIDMELADVSRALRDLVDMDAVYQERGEHPNGTMGPLYSLSETFKAGRDYQVVMSIAGASAPKADTAVLQQFIDRKDEPLPAALVQELSKAGQAAVAAPAPAPVIPKLSELTVPNTKSSPLQLAMDFLKAHGKATNEELRVAMGLGQGYYPTSFLSGAVRRGEISKDGKEWTLGPGKPAPKAPPLSRDAERRPPTPIPSPTPTPAPAVIIGEVKVASMQMAMPVAPAPAFRVGLWSDGVLELRRDGIPVAALSDSETLALQSFLERIFPTK